MAKRQIKGKRPLVTGEIRIGGRATSTGVQMPPAALAAQPLCGFGVGFGYVTAMKLGHRKIKVLSALLLLVFGLGLRLATAAGDVLTWHKDKASVDADILTWDTLNVLERVAEATGWQIYMEPGSRQRVSTKFKDRTPDKALDLLLGNLGRALLPGTNGGPPRLLVFRSAEKNATQRVRAPRKAKHLAKELIVTMKKGKSLDALAKRLGAKVKNRSDGQNAGRLEFDDEAAANAARDALRDNEDVASVDLNYPIEEQPVAEAGAAGNLDLKIQPVKEGEGVIIGLIDSAVQRQGTGMDAFLLPPINVAGEASPSSEFPSHGTSMWETLLKGVGQVNDDAEGSRVRVLSVDVYGNNATTSTFEVAKGIYEAMKGGAQIINLSLGSEGDTPFLYDMIRQGYEAGHRFIASAGNQPVTSPTYPAAYAEVIAVTAGDGRGNIAAYANRGDFVDVIAPGTTTISYNGRLYRVSGTSPAAAYMSGIIAGNMDVGGKTAAQAAAAALNSARVAKP